MLRRLTELPGHPCVLVLCHPVKHPQDPTQLLPRGGGAFLAEMDGNLTTWKRDELIEFHYTKMRGPGFEPMTFKLETIRTTRLVDSKNRILPTVRAVAISRSEEDRQQGRLREDEDRVLIQLMMQPDQSLAAIAEALQWINDKGEPIKPRVQRAIGRLADNSPKLIKKNREKWEVTEEGKKTAVRAKLLFDDRERGGQSALQFND